MSEKKTASVEAEVTRVLELERARLVALLETAPFAVVVYEGREKRVMLSNPRHAEMVGGRHELGKPLLETMPEIAGQPIVAMLDEIYQTGATRTVRGFLVKLERDGVLQDCWFDITSQPMRNLEGEITGVLSSAVEVTEHVRARQQVEAAEERARQAVGRLELLSQASSIFMKAELHLGGLVQMLADQIVPQLAEACSVVLLSKDAENLDLAGWKHTNQVAQEQMLSVIAALPLRVGEGIAGQLIKNNSSVFLPVIDRALWKDRGPEFLAFVERFPIGSLIAVPLRTARVAFGALTAMRSPSQPPFTLDDRDLLEEIGNRASMAIESAQRFSEAKAAVRLRDDFLAIASHELRTPLTSLQLQLEGALHVLNKGEGDAKMGRRLDTANRQVDRLAKLVDNLLDVSRLSIGRLVLDREDVDLGVLVQETAERQTSAAQAAGCHLVLSTGTPVRGSWDRTRIEQVITNLLTNAFKYGPGKPIELTVEKYASRARLTVRDHGMGVRDDDRERIFRRFERAVSSSNYGGLGLGLYISKQIAEAHGGTIEVDPRIRDGACFIVELPHG